MKRETLRAYYRRHYSFYDGTHYSKSEPLTLFWHLRVIQGPLSYLKLLKNGYILALSMVIPTGYVKNWLLRRTGMRVDPTAFISPLVKFDPLFPDLIQIDEGAFLGVGARVFTHVIEPSTTNQLGKTLKMTIKPVRIRKKAFIGGFSTVRAGVTVGEDAVVASDSLVLKDVPDNVLVMGVPAKIRKILDLE